MLKFVCRRQGAISIFLLIVMVPILVISSIFVDMSRIKLAKSVATSAGDLALNTALTDYDAVLKDMYGLFATSQNIDELLENLEDYYKKAIESAGVAPADAEDYVGQIMSMLKSSTGTDDLMNMNLTDFTVTKPTGGNLANPAILKAQVVEFMKYRAPLSLGSGFIEALESMKNLNKQTDLVDDKNKFYDKQKDLLTELESAWREIQTYQYADAENGFPTGTYISDKKSVLDSHATTLKDEMIPDTIKYLYYKKQFKQNKMEIKVVPINDDESLFDDKWFFCGTECLRGFTEENSAETDDVFLCLQNVMTAIGKVKKYTSDSEFNHVYDVISRGYTYEMGQIYAVAQFNKAGTSDYVNVVDNLLQALVRLEAALICCDAEEVGKVKIKYDESTYTVSYDESGPLTLYDFANTQVTSHLTTDSGYLFFFGFHTTRLDGYANTDADPYKKIQSKATTVGAKYDTLRDDTVAYHALITKKIKNLENAIGHLNNVKTDITSESSEYKKALKEWKASANALADDTMGKNDIKEIEKIETMLTEAKLNSLITRLTSAKTTLEDVKTEIEKYKFGGTSWKSIADSSDYEDVLALLAIDGTEFEKNIPTSDLAYDSMITEKKGTVSTGNIKITWNNDVHPDLTKDQRELYTWLYNNYYDSSVNYDTLTSSESKMDDGDAALKTSKEGLENKAKEYSEKGSNSSTAVATNINDYIEYLPSNEWKETLKEIKSGEVKTNQDELLGASSSAVDGVLGEVLGLLGDMGTKLRDDMYISNYIMSMFSYDTFEAEILQENKNKKPDTTPDFQCWYEYDETNKVYKVKDAYKNYAAQALTLTNNSINPNVNYLYGSEVEYIVYGGDDVDVNKGKAYGTIFLLRFAFNTVYAFTDAEINNVTMAAATAIFGTPPLTPLIPIAKIAMTIGLAIAESSYDLYLIKTGDAVPLIKNSKTWIMKPSGAVKAAATVVVNKVVDEAVNKGYDILCDALEKTDDELTQMIDQGTLEVTNLANAAIDSTMDKFKNYANEALQEVVTLCNDAKLEAPDNKTDYVIAGLEDWLDEQGVSTDDTIYEVKSLAVNYLKSETVIGEIITTIDNAANAANPSVLEAKLDAIQVELETRLSDLAEQAGSKLKELKDNVRTEIETAAKKGAEELKIALKNRIGQCFGTSAGKSTGASAVVSNLLSWSYSDYLTLFLLVATVADEKGVLLRMADVIELNMQHMNHEYASITTTETKTVSRFWGLWKYEKEETTTIANQKAFKLSKAYTFLSIEATIEVKPLLMTIPLVEETTESQLTGTKWYEIKYTGTLGY